MRIAFVTTQRYRPWGASEELWGCTALEAVRAGHEVHATTYAWSPRPPRVEELERLGARIDTAPFESDAGGCPAGWFGRRFTRHIARGTYEGLAAFRPDLLVINQARAFDYLSLTSLRETVRRMGTPVVLINHGEGEFTPNFDLEEARDFFRGAAMAGFTSGRSQKAAEVQLGVALPNGFVFRNPVNLERPERLPWPDAREGLRLACVARLDLKKGFDILFESLAGPELRGKPWRLHVYGNGECPRRMEDLACYFGMGERVEFHGFVKDIRDVWTRNHLFVLASRSEGVPLSMVEAMVCGRPCVATDVGGISEWITDGRHGFLAEAATPIHFAAALRRAFARSDDLAAMGREARERAARLHPVNPGRRLLEQILP